MTVGFSLDDSCQVGKLSVTTLIKLSVCVDRGGNAVGVGEPLSAVWMIAIPVPAIKQRSTSKALRSPREK